MFDTVYSSLSLGPHCTYYCVVLY